MSNDFPFNHFINLDKPNKNSNIQNKSIEKYDFIQENIKKEMNTQHSKTQENQEFITEKFDNSELKTLSEEIISGLQQVISPQKFKAYFSNTFNVNDITSDAVIFSVTNSFIKKMIENNYLEQIKQVLFNTLGTVYDVQIQVLGNSIKEISQSIEDMAISNLVRNNNTLTANTTSFKLNEAPSTK